MAEHHSPRGQPLAHRGEHVLLTEDVEHRHATEAGDEAQGVGAEDCGGQHQVAQRIGQVGPVAGEKRVDCVHARHGRGRVQLGREPPGPWQPAQLVEEQIENDQPEPKVGDRDTSQGEEADQAVRQPVVEERGHRAERHTENGGDNDGGEGELQRRREILGQIGRHRALGQLGLAQVAVQEVPEIEPVLDDQGPVQPVLMVEGPHDRRVAQRRLAQVGRGRVAWDHGDDAKGDKSHPEHL